MKTLLLSLAGLPVDLRRSRPSAFSAPLSQDGGGGLDEWVEEVTTRGRVGLTPT